MIDLAELRAVLDRVERWSVERDAWGVPVLVRDGDIVHDLDDRAPVDALLIWAFGHLSEVADELESARKEPA